MAIKKIVVSDPDGVLKKLLRYGSRAAFSIALRGGASGSAAWAGMAHDIVGNARHKSSAPRWYHTARNRATRLELLAGRGKSKRRGVGVWRVGWPADFWYLRFFDTGVVAHRIKGRTSISFRGRNGRIVTTAFVSHPGMKRRPLLRTLVRKYGSKAASITGNAMMERIEEMAD